MARVRTKLAGEYRITLDNENVGASVHKRPREHAGAPAYLENKLTVAELCISDQAGCKLLTTKEVLAASFPCRSPPAGHGRSPWSCRLEL
jgi:hypothetical protein